MASGQDIEANLKAAENFIREAAAQGAKIIQTPEMTDQILPKDADRHAAASPMADHKSAQFFADLAKELSVTLVIGSMLTQIEGDKIANRCFVLNPDGSLQCTYDKIHLYDVDLPTGESWRESHVYEGGDAMVLAVADDVKIGLSICYDVRFPHLYRDMAKAGAQVLSVPAAFTVPTGQAHWEVLLRARAIECGAFVMAAAQVGDHNGARQTYGHSMIINPWGEILAEADGEKAGYIIAECDLSRIDQARGAIPALTHDRDYS